MSLNAEESKLYVDLGLVHIKQQRFNDALDDFRRAVDADAENPQAYQNRGSLHAMQKRYSEAIADFKKVIDLAPQSAQAYFGLAGALIKTKDIDNALNNLKKAAELGHPQAEQYAERLQKIQNQTPPKKLAEATPETAPPSDEPDTNDPIYLNNRGLKLLSKHQYEEALADFKRAIELDPQFAKAHFNAASVLQGQEDWREALEHLKSAVQLGYEPAKTLATEVYRKIKQGPVAAELKTQPDENVAADRDTSNAALLKNAAQTLSKFARQLCGTDSEMVQRTEKGVFGVGERQVTVQEVRWLVSMKTRIDIQPDGTRAEAPGVELDLQQTPRALIRVSVLDQNNYKVVIMAEEKLTKSSRRRALLGKDSETIPADTAPLLAYLNALVQRGTLVQKGNFLRYQAAATEN